MVDRVRPLKYEGTDTGGSQTDVWPTSTNINEDHLDCRGVIIQNDTSDNETVKLSRDASDNLTLVDGVVSGTRNLVDLLTIDDHRTLRQLIHFIDNGPAEGFASGAYREITGTVFPTAIVWWETSSKLKKIVEKLITWTGVNPTTIQWKIYDTDGTSVLATVTDTVSYSGIFETSRTRAIA